MKQKKQLVVLVFLLLIAGFIWFVYFNHDKPIVTADAIPTPQSYQPIGVDNPQLHNDAVERARKTEYKGSGRTLSVVNFRLRHNVRKARRTLL